MVSMHASVRERASVLLVLFSPPVWVWKTTCGDLLHLKGWKPCFHWLQKVGQEIDGARHACKREEFISGEFTATVVHKASVNPSFQNNFP